MVDLTVVLPAYNEVLVIGSVLDELRTVSVPHKVLVVDNKSTDGTGKLATLRGARVIREERPGKGNAIRSGFEAVDTSYIIMVNADHTYPLTYIGTVYGMLKKSDCDVVIGCRELKEKGSISAANTLGNFGLSSLASLLYGKIVYDLCTGMWGFRKEALDKFNLTSERFTLEADLFINAVKNKCKIGQIPIGYRCRPIGTNSKLKITDGLEIARFLVGRRWKS